MRATDADALVYELTEMVRYSTGEYKYGIEAARLVVMDAPTIGGWISVKDRLPEHIGWYLVSLVNNRNGHRWKTPVVCEYSLDVWHENDLFSNDVDATVTHWAYLPEPPQEEVSGDAL